MKQMVNDIKKSGRYLAFKMPQIKAEILQLSALQNFAAVLQTIINYQHTILSSHKVEKLKDSIHSIWRIYVRGNKHIRYLIRNLYLRAQGQFSNRCNASEWILVQSYVPREFKVIYNNLNK